MGKMKDLPPGFEKIKQFILVDALLGRRAREFTIGWQLWKMRHAKPKRLKKILPMFL
ncbi:hypothetical protein [Methanolobus sp.]|uniref:hypothetical protein n=1 Tax=Methanolobus sp. TaxID=1874737 RepID=UPI00273190A5|nr:hypothetical protein [Methanolobus sp.]